MKEYDADEVALVIMKWLDLGPGVAPDDTRWKGHLLFFHDANLGRPDFLGDSRQRFENIPGESEDELLSRNISHLWRRRYKTVMDRLNNNTWFLQAECHLPRSLLSRFLPGVYQALRKFFQSYPWKPMKPHAPFSSEMA